MISTSNNLTLSDLQCRALQSVTVFSPLIFIYLFIYCSFESLLVLAGLSHWTDRQTETDICWQTEALTELQ